MVTAQSVKLHASVVPDLCYRPRRSLESHWCSVHMRTQRRWTLLAMNSISSRQTYGMKHRKANSFVFRPLFVFFVVVVPLLLLLLFETGPRYVALMVLELTM